MSKNLRSHQKNEILNFYYMNISISCIITILLCWRVNILIDRFDSIVDNRYFGPIRGMIDSALDSGMLIMASSEIILLTNTPRYDAPPRAIMDFNHFALLFSNFTNEDGIRPEFQLPISENKCALIRVENPDFQQSLTSIHDVYDSDSNSRWLIRTRGLSRQISQGVCINSPITYNKNTLKLEMNNKNIDKQSLEVLSKYVSFKLDPSLYLSMYIKTNNINNISNFIPFGLAISTLSNLWRLRPISMIMATASFLIPSCNG